MTRGLLPALWMLIGCSSSDFSVGATETDSGATSDSAASDDVAEVGVDAPPDPCAPEPGTAKFCAELKVRGDHPPYDTSSGAASLKLDGRGKLVVLLYDRDPLGLPPGAPAPTPVATIVHPSDSTAEVDIDKDLPVVLRGAAAPGTYTAVAFFADSSKPRGTGEDGLLPGDFVVLPTASGMTFTYPKVTLEAGKSTRVTMELRAVRAAILTLTASPDLKKYPTVHGDGPVLFGLHDSAEINATTSWVHFSTGGCVDLDVDALSPRAQQITFNTTADTSHNIFAAVFDYSTSKPEFPGRGTLISAQSGVMPRLEISKTSWTSSANVELKDVAFGPVELATTDPLRCP